MTTTVVHPYIARKEGVQGGQPVITGTRTPMRSIVFYHKLGEVPEEIAEKFSHLSLAQIDAVLSYNSDHREANDRDIEANMEKAVRREFGL